MSYSLCLLRARVDMRIRSSLFPEPTNTVDPLTSLAASGSGVARGVMSGFWILDLLSEESSLTTVCLPNGRKNQRWSPMRKTRSTRLCLVFCVNSQFVVGASSTPLNSARHFSLFTPPFHRPVPIHRDRVQVRARTRALLSPSTTASLNYFFNTELLYFLSVTASYSPFVLDGEGTGGLLSSSSNLPCDVYARRFRRPSRLSALIYSSFSLAWELIRSASRLRPSSNPVQDEDRRPVDSESHWVLRHHPVNLRTRDIIGTPEDHVFFPRSGARFLVAALVHDMSIVYARPSRRSGPLPLWLPSVTYADMELAVGSPSRVTARLACRGVLTGVLQPAFTLNPSLSGLPSHPLGPASIPLFPRLPLIPLRILVLVLFHGVESYQHRKPSHP
ncbi:hypothetical protein NMY22_g6929 [Coprinellus aureogranulatus]|nr:hypothetical protein NMY22_g6929 [Coprinellus aureogranulatus]